MGELFPPITVALVTMVLCHTHRLQEVALWQTIIKQHSNIDDPVLMLFSLNIYATLRNWNKKEDSTEIGIGKARRTRLGKGQIKRQAGQETYSKESPRNGQKQEGTQ